MRRLAIIIGVLGAFGGTPQAFAASGPDLTLSRYALERALRCPPELGSGAGEPVLLIHGSGGESGVWSWNYLPALERAGMDVCALDLPTFSTGDVQVTSEPVVYAVRKMARLSGERIDLVGHSQGGMQARWATKWWPDVREAVDDLVMLGTPNHGSYTGQAMCVDGQCMAASWQLSIGSRFLEAQNRGDQTPGAIDYSSLRTLTDDLQAPDHPFGRSELDGATNVAVQDLCPGRPVRHFGLFWDAAVHALVMDALRRPGPADLRRLSPSVCLKLAMPGVFPPEAPVSAEYWLLKGCKEIYLAEELDAEPPVASYARSGP